MNTQTPVSLLEKKLQQRLTFTIIFLIFVGVLTLALFLYNRSLAHNIGDLRSQLQEVNDSIRERESDPLIQGYSLYQRNTMIFETLGYQSQVPTFVEHIKNLGLRYGMDLRSFNYSEGKLSMNAQASNDESRLGYQKVVHFMRSYRDDPEALFELEAINSFTGHDRIEYSLDFVLKDTHELRNIFHPESTSVDASDEQREEDQDGELIQSDVLEGAQTDIQDLGE